MGIFGNWKERALKAEAEFKKLKREYRSLKYDLDRAESNVDYWKEMAKLSDDMTKERQERIEWLECCIGMWREENEDLRQKIEMLKREQIYNITINIQTISRMESFKTEMVVGTLKGRV